VKQIIACEVKYPVEGDPTSQTLETGRIDYEGPVKRSTTLLGISECKAEDAETRRGKEELGVREYTVRTAEPAFARAVPYEIQGVPSKGCPL
jgi:hypothetical protein